MAIPDGPYYTNCTNKRDVVYGFAGTVLAGAVFYGFVISLIYVNGVFTYNRDCVAGLDQGCILYNGQTYQYEYNPALFYIMAALTFCPIALVCVASCVFWFLKPPRTV
jgi:hypothetical protein